MSTLTQAPPNGVVTTAQPKKAIHVTYTKTIDKTVNPPQETYTVSVDPPEIDRFKEMPVQFDNFPDGGTVRIVFLSPTGEETDVVHDSQPVKLTTGGFYHFNCYFTPKGETEELDLISGGALDVIPHRP